MRKITGNRGKLISRGTAGALVLLLVLAGLLGWQTGWPPTAAAWKIRPDWSRVQAVKPEARTTVLLYKYQAPRGRRKIKGRFLSATEDSLTLTLKDGQKRTFSKWAVRKVLTRRPIGKRYQAWITLGVSAFFASGKLILQPLLTLPATALAFAVAPKMGGIYNVPPKHRTQPPADKLSGD